MHSSSGACLAQVALIRPLDPLHREWQPTGAKLSGSTAVTSTNIKSSRATSTCKMLQSEPCKEIAPVRLGERCSRRRSVRRSGIRRAQQLRELKQRVVIRPAPRADLGERPFVTRRRSHFRPMIKRVAGDRCMQTFKQMGREKQRKRCRRRKPRDQVVLRQPT